MQRLKCKRTTNMHIRTLVRVKVPLEVDFRGKEQSDANNSPPKVNSYGTTRS